MNYCTLIKKPGFLKIFFTLFITLIINTGLNAQNQKRESVNSEEKYEIYKSDNTDAVLILFGGFAESPSDVKKEFPIIPLALENNITTIIMKFNRKLWLYDWEVKKIENNLHELFDREDLTPNNIYIGGFSSGGNIALILANHLIKDSGMDINGVFTIDPPIDLMALYYDALNDIKLNYSKNLVAEGKWLINLLEKNFGKPEGNLAIYEEFSVFTSSTNDIENILKLRNTRIRFYIEPDTDWWKEKRGVDFQNLNAHHIQNLVKELKIQKFESVELLKSEKRGYRANGERHPHSWSIVNRKNLIEWMNRD